MSTTTHRAPQLPRSAPTTHAQQKLRKVLLACGPLSSLLYVGWHELAALQWDGYSRVSNAISELSLTGAPSRWLLEPWLFLIYNPLVIAFGIGVWRSAQGKRALRVVGGLLVLSGATYPLWLLFGEASLIAHIILAAVGVLAYLGAMGFGAAAFGGRFRLYSLVSLATVMAFFGLAFAYAPEVDAGQPTPFMGLFERIAFGAYFLWVSVLAVALWRTRADQHGEAAIQDRPRAPALRAPGA
jgi:Protein of unknown function (DUF998)